MLCDLCALGTLVRRHGVLRSGRTVPQTRQRKASSAGAAVGKAALDAHAATGACTARGTSRRPESALLVRRTGLPVTCTTHNVRRLGLVERVWGRGRVSFSPLGLVPADSSATRRMSAQQIVQVTCTVVPRHLAPTRSAWSEQLRQGTPGTVLSKGHTARPTAGSSLQPNVRSTHVLRTDDTVWAENVGQFSHAPPDLFGFGPAGRTLSCRGRGRRWRIINARKHLCRTAR